MSRKRSVAHEFVEHLPEHLDEGVLYVSMRFAVAAHRCCCGCGTEVMTPLDPNDWQLTYDGRAISLHPSIGNWSLNCHSHYWIRKGQVVWAKQWSQKEIEAERSRARAEKHRQFGIGGREHQDEEDQVPRGWLRRAVEMLLVRLRQR